MPSCEGGHRFPETLKKLEGSDCVEVWVGKVCDRRGEGCGECEYWGEGCRCVLAKDLRYLGEGSRVLDWETAGVSSFWDSCDSSELEMSWGFLFSLFRKEETACESVGLLYGSVRGVWDMVSSEDGG